MTELLKPGFNICMHYLKFNFFLMMLFFFDKFVVFQDNMTLKFI